MAAEPDPHTTVAEPGKAARVHVADSLTGLEIAGLTGAARLADIGAGAGFPGLALAVALPGVRVDLLESAGRKCAVIGRLAGRAGVGNASVVCARAEDHARAEGAEAYGAVTARAVAPLAVLVEYAAPLLKPGGTLVAWKGRRDAAEEDAGARAAAEVGLEAGNVVRAQPFPAARDHHLHPFRKIAPTPERYPRRAGQARKRPLA